MLTKAEIDNGIKEIPPLPLAVSESIELLNNEVCDFNILQNTIAKDVALSGRILKVSNSPFYGLSGQVSSIKESCVVLGTHTLKNILIAVGVMDKFPPSSGNNIDISKMWHHCYCTAVTAKLLAQQVGVDPEKAFTAGLLHDVGKMVLDVYFSHYYADAISHRKENDCLMIEAESEILGVTHSDVGGKIAACWNLPEDIVYVIESHHDTAEDVTTSLNDIVNLADIVSQGLGYGHGSESLMPVIDKGLLDRNGLTLEKISKSFEEIDKVMSTAKEFIG